MRDKGVSTRWVVGWGDDLGKEKGGRRRGGVRRFKSEGSNVVV